MMPVLSSPSSTLFCAEDADDIVSWTNAGDCPTPTPLQQQQQISINPSFLSYLLSAELDHCPLPDYLSRLYCRSIDPTARQDAISWILKVHEFYRFRPLTAYLAVNYMDRFLSSNTLPQGSGDWPWKLLSVACLSVAAKMEETHVPPPLDMQMVVASSFVFEPRTVQRMELLLMSALRWRMRSVTPFDFLDHFGGGAVIDGLFFSRATELVLSTLRVVEFVIYRPSAIAAAAILCAAEEIGDLSAEKDVDFSYLYETASKDLVEGCRQLMERYLRDVCPSARWHLGGGPATEVRAEPPQSPVAVLDTVTCKGCDTQKYYSTSEGNAEPPSKQPRIGSIPCIDSANHTINCDENIKI